MSGVDPWVLNYFRSIKGQGVKILSCVYFYYSLFLYEYFFVSLNNFIYFYVHPLFLILQCRTTMAQEGTKRLQPSRYTISFVKNLYGFIGEVCIELSLYTASSSENSNEGGTILPCYSRPPSHRSIDQ
jgi:hypothetical protein